MEKTKYKSFADYFLHDEGFREYLYDNLLNLLIIMVIIGVIIFSVSSLIMEMIRSNERKYWCEIIEDGIYQSFELGTSYCLIYKDGIYNKYQISKNNGEYILIK